MSRAPRAIASACLVAGLLAGCGSQPSGTGSTTPSIDWPTIIHDAQIGAEGFCAITPTAATITSIVIAATTGSAGAAATEALATAAAQTFCKAVTGTQATSIKLGARRAVVRLRAPAPVASNPGLVDYGTLTINGRIIDLQGTPIAQ